MPKVLVVHPYTRTSTQLAGLCVRGLNGIGCLAEAHLFHPGRYSSRPWLGGFKSAEYALSERALMRRTASFSPDLVLVIKGEELLPRTIDAIRRTFRVPVADWWTDDPCLLGVSSRISPAYDVFFTNDPDSVPSHSRAGCRRAEFLTFACDPALHRRTELTEAERGMYACDMVFVGLLTPRRARFLEPLAGPGLRIWSKPVLQEYLPETDSITRRPLPEGSPLRGCVTGREAWDEELAKIYSAAKIVLNVHAHGSSDPNIRVFEATGCGAFLLTESRRVLGDLFSIGGELACFSGPEELKAQAGRYLRDDAERLRVAAAGQARAYKDHTYAVRMTQMLARLGLVPSEP